ncbi:MAG: DUF2029 domain-containing protein [Alphaproteobacteria bacterium]
MSIVASLRSGDWLISRRLRHYPVLFLLCWLVVATAWVANGEGVFDPAGKPLGTDFVNVWAASIMALRGEAAGVYDFVRHGAVEQAVMGPRLGASYYGWHYPPMFLLVVLPVALLSYGSALLVYLAVTLQVYWPVVRAIIPGRTALLAAFAFPGAWINIGHGQNGFLTTGLLGGGLVLLDRRPALAGVLLGLLSYKPQFGLLIPLALMVTGRWVTIAAAAVTVGAVSLVSLVVFGEETWRAFLASTEVSRTIILERGATGWYRIQSVFSAARLLGASVPLAYGVQAAAGVAAAVAVVRVWRQAPSPGVAAAILVAATPLTTPYILDYDLVMLILPLAWMAREIVEHGALPWEKTVLAAVWLLPLVARTVALYPGLPLTPLGLVALVVVIMRRAAVRPAAP